MSRAPVIQPAAQQQAIVREWAVKRLRHLMGFDDVDGVADYLMALDAGEDVQDYIKVRQSVKFCYNLLNFSHTYSIYNPLTGRT
jgi:hypothetical protein